MVVHPPPTCFGSIVSLTPTPRVQVVFLLLFPRSVIPHSFLLVTMSSSQCPPPTRTKLTSLPPLLHYASTSPPLPGYILTQSTSSCPPHRSHLALRDTGEPHNRPNPYFWPIDSLVRPLTPAATMPKVSTKEEKKVKAAAPEKKKRAKKEKDPNKPKRWVCSPAPSTSSSSCSYSSHPCPFPLSITEVWVRPS